MSGSGEAEEDAGAVGMSGPRESRPAGFTGGGHAAAASETPAAPAEALDPTVVARHSYLGEVDDLEGGMALLTEGQVYSLPVLPLDGLVLCPGGTLPLRLTFPSDLAMVHRALEAPPPLTRLIAVVCCRRGYFTPHLELERVGCVAEIRKMGSGGVNLLAKGRQRVEVQLEAAAQAGLGLQLSSVPARVLPEPPPLRVPREAAAGLAWHPRQLYARYDAWALAKRARRLFQAIAPQAREFRGGPVELSYHLLGSMPVEDDARQRLLEAATVDERLRESCRLLAAVGELRCRACGARLCRAADAVQMSEEGISACFVNSHSFVHDILTLGAVTGGLLLEGEPETAHSWFPGYAWQCAYCECGQHVGWKFLAARPGLQPAAFWGLRRPAMRAGTGAEAANDAGAAAFMAQLTRLDQLSSEDGGGGWSSADDNDGEEEDWEGGVDEGAASLSNSSRDL